MFGSVVSMLMATVQLVSTGHAFHILDRFIVGARLIDTERTGVASAVLVRKIMVLRVWYVEESDMSGALGGIFRRARRKFGHSSPEWVV